MAVVAAKVYSQIAGRARAMRGCSVATAAPTLEVHASHVSHPAHATHSAHAHVSHPTVVVAVAAERGGSLLGCVGDQRLGGEQDAGDAGGVLQRDASDLGRVDDARLEPVLVFPGGGVLARGALGVAALLDH